MKVLVIGGGGREHAVVYKLSQSKEVKKIYCAPGNGGISLLAETVPIKADDVFKIKEFCLDKKIDLVVVGPEVPLVSGIADELLGKVLVFGPKRRGAMLEGSKIFAKNFMKRHNIPTAPFKVFESKSSAFSFAKRNLPSVIKADGLCGGKGTSVCKDEKEVESFLKLVMEEKIFGEAGKRVLVEECLFGEEASYLIFVKDGEFLPLPTSQDHKPIYDGDKGPNTGGMGAYSPAPVIDKETEERIIKDICKPTIEGLLDEGIDFCGILYIGLMITEDGPFVLEYNVRFGDPEAQPILFRMRTDIIEPILATIQGGLGRVSLEFRDGYSLCVVLAQAGYPGKYEKGEEIFGLSEVEKISDVYVFHAGTKREGNRFFVNGGRVLGVTAWGPTIKEAKEKAYLASSLIDWKGKYHRNDIGDKAIKRLS